MKVQLFLREPRANKPTLIIASLSLGKSKYRVSTKLSIEPKHWSKTKQQVKNSHLNNTYYNQILQQVCIDIECKYLEYISKYDNINSKLFKEYLNNEQKHSHNEFKYVFDVMYRYYDSKALRMLKSSLKTYKGSCDNVKRFELCIGYNGLNDIKTFINDYTDYELGNGNTLNTIMKRIRHIKTALSYFNVKGYSDVYVKKINTHHVYLNEQEIEMIINLQVDSTHLNNSRKLFLVQLHTGLRVSDLMKLPYGHINDVIKINVLKTKEPISIPVHPNIKDIINHCIPISSQKYNTNIKTISKLANITYNDAIIQNNNIITKPKYKLITSHTARRSFATNNIKYLPHNYIMKLMAISSYDTFKKYVKLNDYDVVALTIDAWKTVE